MRPGTRILGNVYDKYGTQNPLARLLFQNFLRSVRELLGSVSVSSLLEVGCGEGYLSRLMSTWLREVRVCAVDLSEELFDPVVIRESEVSFSVQSVYQLGFSSNCFDMVVGAEVLEHLSDPQRALEEVRRVARNYVLLSVPREPIWRFMNLARFAYWSGLGNTPGHIQHWSARRFQFLVGRHFEIVQVRNPLPWTVVLAVKKTQSS